VVRMVWRLMDMGKMRRMITSEQESSNCGIRALFGST
jgi:hypothetical protein